jgi:hypothetical protein
LPTEQNGADHKETGALSDEHIGTHASWAIEALALDAQYGANYHGQRHSLDGFEFA